MLNNKVRLGDLIEVLTDYHANGAYKKLKENVELLDDEDYALMVRTTNFENNDFHDSVKYISEHAYNFLEKSKVYPNDLIMNKIANAGSIYLMPDLQRPVSLAMNLFLIRVNEKLANPVYVYLYLKINEQYVKQFANGSVTKTITKEAVRNLEIFLPSREEQNIVVEQYLALDNKINLNLKINQNLESIAQAIFKSWFVDFEPVRAKIAAKQEGKDPELAAMCAISGKSEDELDQLTKEDFAELKATAARFPDELVESELGEVPRGWSSVSIGSLIDLTIGGDWGKEVKDEKYKVQARVIHGTDIPSIKSGLDEQVPTRYIESKKLRTRELKLGDIVIEVSGGSPKQPTGRTIYISNEILLRLKDPVIPASFCRLLRPNSHELGVFLSIYLQKIYVEGKTWLYQNQSTGISNFQTTVFLEKEILTIPPLILLEEFEKIITPIIKKIDSSERLFLSNLRDILLPKLLSGEITLNINMENIDD